MNRDTALRAVRDRPDPWDVVVIGGGATGLGAAVDAASRGYATLLVEQHDFAKGTSSRSTKLIHGGVRYLAQGRVGLVRAALRERELLLRNAPHLVHELSFVIPAYALGEIAWYFAGLKVYDLLAGRFGQARSRRLTRAAVLERLPTLSPLGLRGGILFRDSQFDDARLAVTLARTLFDLGGVALNYARVAGLLRKSGRVAGVRVQDVETGQEYEVCSRVVVNATGVFVDEVRRMDDPAACPMVTPSRGVHLVLARECLPAESALLVPRTDDGRVLFAIPWHDRLLVGTTDTPVDGPALEPRAAEDELEFLLRHAARYLATAPRRSDVLSVFAGLRPLVGAKAGQRTAAASRDHQIDVSNAGLVTITGGKWTTYRHMGESVIDRAARLARLPARKSPTRDLRLHGWSGEGNQHEPLAVYGADAAAIRALAAAEPAQRAESGVRESLPPPADAPGETLHARLPYLKAEVAWGARHEMARTVEDVLCRRTRALFLDARASVEAAPVVAEILSRELGRTREWVVTQIADFTQLAAGYTLSGSG
ncbi:MAG: glycerol-3-phosphate dehydrogenase/oxidase [Planctomycetaceae bacterium]